MKKIPDGWHEVTIEDIASVDSGQGAPQGDKWFNGEKIFIKAGDLNNLTEGKYVGDYCQKISNEAIGHYNLKEYPANSIVFPKSGMSVKTDNIALLKYDSYVVNHLAIVKVKEDLCSEKYLYYLFKGKKISNLSLNDSYPSIRLQDIKNFRILLPPLPTQKKIAAVLEKAQKLREWRKEADELTDRFLKSTFLEMFGDPIKNPKKWKKRAVKEFGKVITGNTPPRMNSEYYGNYIEWIKSDNINTPHTYLTKSEEMLSEAGARVGRIVPKGSVLVTCIAGSLSCIGNVAITDREVAFNQQINAIVPNKEVNEFFLYHLILDTKEYIQNFSTQSMKGMLSKSVFESIPFIFPPTDLQNKFGLFANEIEELRKYQNQSRLHIDNFFNVLMQRAFRGELEAK